MANKGGKPMTFMNLVKTAGLASLVWAAPAFAEPVTVPVQGLLADADGKPVESVQDATFQIVDANGDVVWEEVQSIAADNGLFSVWLGSRTELDSAVFITPGIQLKMNLGNDSLGPWNLGFAPYAVAAIYAKDAQNATTLDGQEASAFAAADHAHTLEVGAGLSISEAGEVSVDQSTVEGWAQGVAFDTAEEVTAALGDTYLASEQCAEGQVLKRDANGWACAADAEGDSVSAGAGIAISGEGVVAVANGGISLAMLADGSVGNAKLANGSVNAAKLSTEGCAVGEVLKRVGATWECSADVDTNTTYTAGSGLTLAAGTFSIGENQILENHIADNAIGASQIQANAVSASEIAANAVGASEIAVNAVGASEIAANAVSSSEIATNAVGALEIASGAVGYAEIATDAVRASEIQDGAVGAAEIATGAVRAAEIQDGAVGAAEIATDAVRAAEIQAGAVGSSEIANGSIVNTDISGSAAIARSKLAAEHATYHISASGSSTTNGTNLRNAVLNANANCNSPKVIRLTPGTYDLGANYLVLDECMSIVGPGPRLATIVSTNTNSRVVNGAAMAVVSGVTLWGKGASGNSSTSVVYNASNSGSWAYRSQFLLSNCYIKQTDGTSDNTKHVIYNIGEIAIEHTSIYSNIGGSAAVHGVRTSGSDSARTYMRDSTIYMERSSGTGNKYGMTVYNGADVNVHSSFVYASTQSSSEGYGIYSSGTGSIAYVFGSTTYGQKHSAYETGGGDVTFYGGRLGNNENSGVSCTGMRAYSGNSGLDGGCD
jgi:hypothetical protein